MKLQFNRFALLAFSSLMLVGCASGYKSFYKPASGVTPEAIAARRAGPPPATPVLERSASGNFETILAAYMKRGYGMIGHSIFNSGKNESEASALEQGKTVGADLVLVLNPQYTGSVTSNVPITIPTVTQSYTTGSATAYGSGGSATAYGNATTTTYGSQTTYIPITTHRSDYCAIYFVKARFTFGALVRDLNDGERQALQTNQGVVVVNVVDDSPAFRADILPGDVIVAYDGVTIPHREGFSKMNEESKGMQVTITIIRHGERLEKSVQMMN